MVQNFWYFEALEEKDRSVNQLMIEVFVEQPRLHRVCCNYNFKYIKFLNHCVWDSFSLTRPGRSWSCHVCLYVTKVVIVDNGQFIFFWHFSYTRVGM